MKKIVGIVVLLVLVGAAVFTQDKLDRQHKVASVNGVAILRGTLHNKLEERFGRMVLEQLIMEELIKQEAKKKKIKIDDKEVQARMSEIKKQMGSTEKFNQALAQNNMTESEMKQQIRIEITLEKFIEKEINEKEVDALQKEKKIGKQEARRIIIGQKIPPYLDKLKQAAKIEINF